ncbi:MAG: MCE family protein [Myxococcota bacterium]
MRTLVLATLLVGCSHEMTAQLSEAEGLAEGAPVTMHGVQVGTVKAVGLAGGAAPIAVTFDVSEHYDDINMGACATADARGVELHSDRGLQPIVDDVIVPCPPTATDTLGDMLQGAIEATAGAVSQGAAETGRAAGAAAGAELRGVAEGLQQGLGENGARDIGRILGEQAREFVEGASEGATGMNGQPLPPPPNP